jgi:hypothetical protein
MSDLKLAQALCKAVTGYEQTKSIDAHTRGAIVSLVYANDLCIKDAEWLSEVVSLLGGENVGIWVKVRKRKKLPFELCELPAPLAAVKKEFCALNDYYSLGGTLPNKKPPHLLGGRGDYLLWRDNRWSKQRASVEELPVLLQADQVTLDDVKHVQGTETLYAYVCDWETKKKGYSSVRIAASEKVAVRHMGEKTA